MFEDTFDDDGPRWNSPVQAKRSAARLARDRSRVTVQLTPQEKQAVDWLSRLDTRTELPSPFRALRGTPARQLVKILSVNQLRRLTQLFTAIRTPPPVETPE